MRPETEEKLRARLHDAFEIGQHPLQAKSVTVDAQDGVTVEEIGFTTASGAPVRGLLTRPPDIAGQAPAILYIHAHGNRYDIGADELTRGRPALRGPLGGVLAQAGFVTLAIDLPCFGTRAAMAESASAKAALWHGRSLAGQMLGELHSALGWLMARPDVDPARTGAFGISMGATLGYWLAAVETRLSAVAQLCCFADFASLIATGAHDLHGLYLTVPGLLDIADNGTIAGLLAPRPQFIGIGDRDPLTPPGAVDPALERVRAAYAARDAAELLCVHREPETGHEETEAMRTDVLRFLNNSLAE